MPIRVKKPYIYLAGPLFSEAERSFNLRVKRMLQHYVSIYLPQEDGGLFVDMIDKGTPKNIAKQQVFEIDKSALHKCDAFVIILDGRTVDEGAAFELGCAYILDKPCFGLKTDPRQLLQNSNNPMIDVALQEIFISLSELEAWAKRFAQEYFLSLAHKSIYTE